MKKFLTLLAALIVTGSMTVVQADTWTPAGTPASVFTDEWEPNTPANDMVLSNGLYVFAKRSDFAQTPIQFKVCKDHAWTTAYPGSNYSFTIPAGAKHLIITYNPSGNAVNAFAISSMTVAGDNATLFGDTWKPANTANDMALQSDGTYKFEKSGVALSAGMVNFKACANHGWDNAWPSSNYSLSIPESGNYTITITFNPATLSVSATADLEEAVVVIPTIQLHSNITNPSWESSANFALAGNEETASLTLTGVTKGNYEFGVKIDGTWTSNGSGFTRANPSHTIAAGSGNCTFNADRNGDYTFTWTYATNTLSVTYPAVPAQSVELTGLSAQILKGTEVTFTASSSGIDEPGYRFYVKEKNGGYGSAVASYTFDAVGEYVVKVEALEYNTGDPVADDESEVLVYDTHTFTNGTTIYVDFSAMTEGTKGVNYPKVGEVGLDYDDAGAGTLKTVAFNANVTWTTNDVFIKTEKAGWAELKFIVPGDGQNCVVVAADGASYTWGIYSGGEPEHTYTVAGPETFFSTNWDATNTDNDMALDDGLYKLTKANVVVADETTIEFKVCQDHAWTVAFPGDNYSLYFANGGTYSITYTFNTEGNAVGVDIPSFVAMHGNFAGVDSWADTKNFVVAPGGATASLTMTLAARDNYEFGMRLRSNGNWTSNGASFSRATPSASIVAGEGNITLNADVAGEYTFTWTFATNTLSITYPEGSSSTPTAVAAKGGWDSWADPLNFTPALDGLTATATLSELPAGNYEFKLIIGETTDDAATWDWRSNANAYHRFWTSASGITSNNDLNMELQADADGDYILTWTFATNALSITFPETPKTGTNEVKFFPPRTEEHPWNSVYVYAWRRTAGEDARLTDEWPGDLATKDGEWYKATIAKGACAIFHDNAGMQSFDIENVQKDVCYISNEIDYTEHEADPEKPVKAKFVENCTVSYFITGDEAIMGAGNAWKADLAERQLDGSDEITLSNLPAGIYEFKLTNGSWAWSIGGKEHLKGGDCSNVAVTSGSGNVKFKIESTQDVTITYFPATQQICLSAETMLPFEDVRTGLTADNYYTVCYNREMKQIRGASLWSFAGKDENFAYLVREDAPFAAGKPFIIYAESDKLEAVLDGSTEVAGSNNGLYGTLVYMDATALSNAGATYMLKNNELRPIGSNNHLAANRAYIKLNEIPDGGAPAGLPKHRVRAMPTQSNVATDIDAINASDAPVKMMIDGELFIRRGENLYDATGRLVK